MSTEFRIPAALAAIIALGVPALAAAQSGAFGSSGWIGPGVFRSAPSTTYTGNCVEVGCRADQWFNMMDDRGEPPLEPAKGGRVYRFVVNHASSGKGLKIVRLDVGPDGKASLSWSYPNQPRKTRAVTAATLAAFDNAMKASAFEDAEPNSAPVCTSRGDEVVLEAVVGDQYKNMVEPCGGEAGLTKALGILEAGT